MHWNNVCIDLLVYRPTQAVGSAVVEENVQHAEYPNRAIRVHHIN